MAETTLTATEVTDTTMNTILSHLKTNFSLSSNDVEIMKITPENLPSGVEQYYVEKKASYGNINYNYLVFGHKLFCSKIEGDFGRFLQTYGFLQKKDINETQLLKVFRVLQLKDRNLLIIDKEGLAQESLKSYLSQLSAPKLSFTNDGGATLTFFTRTIRTTPVEKWTVSIAPNYKVSVTNMSLAG